MNNLSNLIANYLNILDIYQKYLLIQCLEKDISKITPPSIRYRRVHHVAKQMPVVLTLIRRLDHQRRTQVQGRINEEGGPRQPAPVIHASRAGHRGHAYRLAHGEAQAEAVTRYLRPEEPPLLTGMSPRWSVVMKSTVRGPSKRTPSNSPRFNMNCMKRA